MTEHMPAASEQAIGAERAYDFAVRLEALTRQYQIGGEANQVQRDLLNAMTKVRMLKTDVETNAGILEVNATRLHGRLLELGETRLRLSDTALLEANGAEILQITGDLARNNTLIYKAKLTIEACEQDIADLEERLAQCQAYHTKWTEALSQIAPLMAGLEGLESIADLSEGVSLYGDVGELAERVHPVAESQATFSVQVMGIMNTAMSSAQDTYKSAPRMVNVAPTEEQVTEVTPVPADELLPALDHGRLASLMRNS